EFRLVCRDNDFTTQLVGYTVFVAELDQFGLPRHAGLCLQRAWGVVDARVDDAAVMPCLVLREFMLLFEYHHFYGRIACQHLPRCGQPHNPAADNPDVIFPFEHNARNSSRVWLVYTAPA